MLDKWAFTMSKIDGEESKSGSYTNPAAGPTAVNGTGDRATSKDASDKDYAHNELAIAAGNISLSNPEPNTFGAKSTIPHPSNGPSLLTQQALSHSQAPSTSTSSTLNTTQWSSSGSSMMPPEVMSVDARSIQSTSSTLEGNERITVKIADLGNGQCPNCRRIRLLFLTTIQPRGQSITSRTTSRLDSTAVQKSSSARNGVRVQIFGASPVWSVFRLP